MKPFTFFMGLLCFFVVEAAFVSYVPASSHQRTAMHESIPYVSHWNTWQQARMVRTAFNQSVDGQVSTEYGFETHTWTSPDEILDNSYRGDKPARAAIWELEFRSNLRKMMVQHRTRAEAGSLPSMIDYYISAVAFHQEADSNDAREMLEQHPSATARLVLRSTSLSKEAVSDEDIQASIEWAESREGRLLLAKASRETVHALPEDMESERRNEALRFSQETLEELRSDAANGDPDAIWIVEQLDATPVWRPKGDS